jgi:Mg/Co/Ni transporter MgtE
MQDYLKYLSRDELEERLDDGVFLHSLSPEDREYIAKRMSGELRRNCATKEEIDKAIAGYQDMSREQLIEFFTMYEMGEYVTTEEEMDYLMSRIGDWMGYRPHFYSFEFSRKQLKELENHPELTKEDKEEFLEWLQSFNRD